MIDNIKPTILYVEDEEGIRKELSRFLDYNSSQLYIAIDGKDGLDKYKEFLPDIVISDIKMPIMNGIDMVKEIKKINRTQHIIFTTAHNESKYFLEVIEMQVDGYILKPVDYDKLEYKIDRINELIKQKNELEMYQKSLEIRVEEEIAKSKEKEEMLFHQSKLAQMGEMLNMIAHQWRQPLSAISSSAINIELKQQLGTLQESDISTSSQFIQETALELSKIINDFMDFNKPSNNQNIILNELINKVHQIISSQLISKNIKITIDINENIKVFHNITHIEHILLNIIINARDAFENIDIINKEINIYTTQNDKFIILNIEDNAGGIPDNIINRIFEPYFTTKEEGKGTGIGLYMSKKMFESIGNSKINVKIKDNHTIFMLEFSKI